MKIEVTEDDIRNGKSYDCMTCPIALALSRAFKESLHVRATPFSLFVDNPPRIFNPPQSVVAFMVDFDMHHPVQPFTFEL